MPKESSADKPRAPRAAAFFLVGAMLLAFNLHAPPPISFFPGGLVGGPKPESGPANNPVINTTSGRNFDYILIILMENHAICNIMTSCGGSAPYMTGLANANGLATRYVDCNRPSLPNYLCLSGGTDFGCGGYDGGPHSNPCTNAVWNSQSIVDRLVNASLTWKAYMEDMPSNCYGSDSGLYIVHHDPFVYYGGTANNATRCNRVIPAGTGASTLLSDLGSTSTASNYMWLTPNNCNNMHSCSVSTGDNYLQTLVPQILNSTVFKTTRAALFITFDEDSGGSGRPNLYTVWAGPVAKKGFTSSIAYNHFSLLATIESNWNLSSLTSNDGSAANMNEFLGTNPATPNPAGLDLGLLTYALIVVAAAGIVAGLLWRRRRRRTPPT